MYFIKANLHFIGSSRLRNVVEMNGLVTYIMKDRFFINIFSLLLNLEKPSILKFHNLQRLKQRTLLDYTGSVWRI